MKSLLRPLSFLIIAALAAGGCGKDDPISPPGEANVMFVHASADAPAVDIDVDGQGDVDNLSYPNSAAYGEVDAGTRTVDVELAGTTTTVVDSVLAFTNLSTYSVFLVDSAAVLSMFQVSDDLTDPPAGQAKIRFVHAVVDGPAVDVGFAGQAALFTNRTFISVTAFTTVTAGAQDIEVRLAGTSTVVASLTGQTLLAGKIYTVVGRGIVAGIGPQAPAVSLIVNK